MSVYRVDLANVVKLYDWPVYRELEGFQNFADLAVRTSKYLRRVVNFPKYYTKKDFVQRGD